MILQQGTSLQQGKYIIERKLGQGGFGITYLAVQEALNRKVAIKEFFMRDFCERGEETTFITMGTKSNRETVDGFRRKFQKEAENIATLSHPGIVNIYDVFEENNTVYYVMEYLSGGSLTEQVKKYGPLNPNTASKYIRQIAEALDYMHNCPDPDDPKHTNKMLHLDVKPSNIMLNASGNAVLVDFGLSKRYDDNGGQTSSTPLGISEGFAPLEQYEAGGIENFTPASDIYSLGATFLYLLTGKKPPKASAVLHDGLPKMGKNIPLKIQYAIKQAMQPNRNNRPQDITQLLRLMGGKPSKPFNVKILGGIAAAILVVICVALFAGGGKADKLFNEGMSYIEGDESKWNVPMAIARLTEAAEMGHTEAMLQLGGIYYTDEYDVENDEKAEFWFKKAADEGYLPGQVTLGMFYDDDAQYEKAAKYLMPAAEKGHPMAQNKIGEYCEDGDGGLNLNEHEAFNWYTKAAQQNEPEALYNLAVCYLEGIGTNMDNGNGFKWMVKAAEAGNADALLALGRSYIFSTFTEENYAKAEKYLHKAIESNPHFSTAGFSYYYLGELEYANANTDKAYDYYLKAAQYGHPKAICEIGKYYFIGQGKINNDYAEAYTWFKKAADMNYSDAQYWLGFCLAHGLGVDKNELKALEYWDKAANKVNEPSPLAMIELAKAYEKGNVLEKNVIKAVEYYKKATKSKNAQAVKLAKEHLENLGYY